MWPPSTVICYKVTRPGSILRDVETSVVSIDKIFDLHWMHSVVQPL